MLARRARRAAAFTRRDAVRLFAAASILAGLLGAILAIDIRPSQFTARVGDVAPVDVAAPRELAFTSEIETQERREAARQVPPEYTYSPEQGQLSAARQTAALEAALGPVDAAFDAVLTPDGRRAALAAALPDLSVPATDTLQALDRFQWAALRAEMLRVLQNAQAQEVRDATLQSSRTAIVDRVAARFPTRQRGLAGEIMGTYLVANSTYDPIKTAQVAEQRAAAVEPVSYTIKKGELLVRKGDRISETDFERIQAFGLGDPTPDTAKLGGWLLLSGLGVALLLAWMWRFRPAFWHRNNALLLVGMLLVLEVLALKATGERSVLPYVVPTAAAGLLIAILLDSSAAIVIMAVVGVIGATITGTVELAAYIFLGSFAGIVVIRRGDRFAHFVQAALAMAATNVVVVSIFTLLGERDPQGVLQLWGASVLAAGGSAVAAVGSFAVLGNLFGITTHFQLLELANPSQKLLRRLLLETPGTYHHSLMVGNLAERAAEATGADPLLARVGAYYHDIGKLANPVAFIENQAGGQNIHDELTPERSATVLKAHVANGIDLAYEYRLPKAVIALIPQHHGTALMSYFYARAKEQAVREAGATPATAQAEAAEASVDQQRFRHAGPKPQTREAAILMLADGVEASVRSLTSHDEPAIRAMVQRIIRERLDDGQFDECDLTLRDVERIREAFVAQLLGMYHRRIEYPQNKIVELEARRAANR